MNDLNVSQKVGASLRLEALVGLPLIEPGDDLAGLLIAAIERSGLTPHAFDVLVVAQKVVSKAEGRSVRLSDVIASPQALSLAKIVDKDPRLVHLILSESSEVIASSRGVLIVAHRLGFVMANAGIDQSNVDHGVSDEFALLLPEDPDRSCAAIRNRIAAHFGVEIAVVMNDSFGRAWRIGTTGVAIGGAGLPSVLDCIGEADLFGRKLRVTQIGFADEIASAASLLMGQAAQGQPAVLIRGLNWLAKAQPASSLVRPKVNDLFRRTSS